MKQFGITGSHMQNREQEKNNSGIIAKIMDSGLQNHVFSENSILKRLLCQNPTNSTSDSHLKPGSGQNVIDCESSADLPSSTLQLSRDLPSVLPKPIVVSDIHAIPDDEHAVHKPGCRLEEITEVGNQLNVHLSFSSTLTKISYPADTSLQSRGPTIQQLYQEPTSTINQHSFSGHCKSLPTFQDSFHNASNSNTLLPFKKRLIENWTVQPNREIYQGDPAPVQRNKEHQKLVLSIPRNNTLKIYEVIKEGFSNSKISSPSSQSKGNKIHRKSCYSQNSLFAQLPGPAVVVSPESFRLSVARVSETSGHTYSTAESIEKYSTSSTEDKRNERSCFLGNITHSTTDIVKMSNGIELEESDVCVQKVFFPASDPWIPPSSSPLQNISFQCQTSNVEQRVVNRRPSTHIKTMLSVNDKPNTNIHSESDDVHRQSKLQGSSSLSIPVIDVETGQSLADDEIMFGYPTNIFSVVEKDSNSLVSQNPSNSNAVPLDLRVNKLTNSTVLNDSATEEERLSVENDSEKEPSSCDVNRTEMNDLEKNSTAYIENENEIYSEVCNENAIEKEFRACDENGTESNSRTCHDNYSENRSTPCSETNNEKEPGVCDDNESEKENKAFDEIDLLEAFEMDEEGFRELGNNIRGLEDIMEYLARNDETCNQFGYAEIASSARRKYKKRSRHQRGEKYNLRSKVDLSRMIITRGQKRSGKSKFSDLFSRVGIIGRHSARASNSRMGNTSMRSNKNSCNANTFKMEAKDTISSQLHTKKITDCPESVPANSSDNHMICLKVDKGTGEINTEQKIPEYCPACLELLCPSRFVITLHNFSLKTVCVGCGSAISMVFEPVSGSCIETARIHSIRKSKRKKGR